MSNQPIPNNINYIPSPQSTTYVVTNDAFKGLSTGSIIFIIILVIIINLLAIFLIAWVAYLITKLFFPESGIGFWSWVLFVLAVIIIINIIVGIIRAPRK